MVSLKIITTLVRGEFRLKIFYIFERKEYTSIAQLDDRRIFPFTKTVKRQCEITKGKDR